MVVSRVREEVKNEEKEMVGRGSYGVATALTTLGTY